jgi:DNA-binding response OmpR family regulator
VARILVVDDSPSIYFNVRRSLTPDRHQVDRLEAFTELPGYLRTTPPDLVLLDLEMPALSGTAFAQFLRRIETRPTHIVIHSALDDETLRKAAREVGALGAIRKGTSGEQLRSSVNRYLLRSGEKPREV